MKVYVDGLHVPTKEVIKVTLYSSTLLKMCYFKQVDLEVVLMDTHIMV